MMTLPCLLLLNNLPLLNNLIPAESLSIRKMEKKYEAKKILQLNYHKAIHDSGDNGDGDD